MTLGHTDLYFDVTVAIILVVTASGYYENTVKRRAATSVADLADQKVESVRLADSNTEIPREQIDPGDEILVQPGERIPLDGTVVEGTAALDESLVSGESRPRQVRPGDEVRGGTICTDSPVVVAVGPAAESTLDRLLELLGRPRATVPVPSGWPIGWRRSSCPLLWWWPWPLASARLVLGGAPSEALLAALTVVIVSCPCALGVATPSRIRERSPDGSRPGRGDHRSDTLFESAGAVDTVVLDKTGTLTDRDLGVEEIHGDDPDRCLEVAAALEANSAHPLARAICDASEEPITRGSEIDVHAQGLTGKVEDRPAAVGHPAFLTAQGYKLDSSLEEALECVRDTAIPVVVGWDGHVCGIIAIGEQDRAGWERTVTTLGRDRELVVLTGDDRRTADPFLAHEAVDEVITGVPPDGKEATVRRLQGDGTVAMVGDGSNDAPALAAADLGIAIGSGTAMAADAADVVLVEDELDRIEETIELAVATRGRIRGNLAWAFSYNAVAIPLAAAGILNPLFAALAMASSSLIVVLNSARPLTD
ncbi:MAG: heavy metal translocating P-type ATPase [Natrialbaceae archaeon]|nr:heavy metal translocating P-type ATPase [Natrialbaceae archaeon]